MKVYVAAPYPLRDQAQRLARVLTLRGIEVTSTWLREVDKEEDKFARIDLADVARADVLFALNPEAWKDKGTGGRHVEFGYAYALKKPILVMGVRSNLFHHLNDVTVIEDGEDFIKHLLMLGDQ